MAIAKITLIGMYDYMASQHDDMFQFLRVPDGVDRETLINNILMENGEFPMLWANPFFVQRMIGVWSNKNAHSFDRVAETLANNYDPLHNYDRYEEWEDNAKNTAENTNEVKVSAYDSATLQPNTASNSDIKGNTDSTHKGHLYGNIGVTTSQQMALSELELRETNIYDYITESFKREFCVMVY